VTVAETTAPRVAPPVGLRHAQTRHVDASWTVTELGTSHPIFKEMPRVLATACMVAFVEATCAEALKPYLGAGEISVGTQIQLSHQAPTPEGMRVTVECQLAWTDGREVLFDVRCWDELQTVGMGMHHRHVVDTALFAQRAEARRARAIAPETGALP
jgi:fluoroacetyl-CoA thioesterase